MPIGLFVAMLYRSMKSTNSIAISTPILEPAMLVMGMLIFSVVVSLTIVSYKFYEAAIKKSASTDQNKYPKIRSPQYKSRTCRRVQLVLLCSSSKPTYEERNPRPEKVLCQLTTSKTLSNLNKRCDLIWRLSIYMSTVICLKYFKMAK
jgi:hypothetical protein